MNEVYRAPAETNASSFFDQRGTSDMSPVSSVINSSPPTPQAIMLRRSPKSPHSQPLRHNNSNNDSNKYYSMNHHQYARMKVVVMILIVLVVGSNLYLFVPTIRRFSFISISEEGVGHAERSAALLNWLPTEMIDALLLLTEEAEEKMAASSSTTASAHTPQGIPRLIVAASNADYADFADNFANSLLALNITNFVFLPLDQKAYDILSRAYPLHTLPPMPHLDNHPEGPASFGDSAFKSVTATRPTFLLPFLMKGYAIFYNDIDIVWQHNAWDVIDERDEGADVERTLWKDTGFQICSCMMYLLPTSNSIALLRAWETELATPHHKNNRNAFDQDALAVVAKRLQYPFNGGTLQQTTVYNNDEQFPAGKYFSWNETKPENGRAVIVHNNWIVGKESKKGRFEEAGLWNPSGRLDDEADGDDKLT
jgi:Nucleotide-diphospho-sugar transferase